MSPQRIQTEAGRAMLARGSNNWSGADWIARFRDAILAIEAEAVSTIRSEAGPLDVERLARALAEVRLSVAFVARGQGGSVLSDELAAMVAAEYSRLSEEPVNEG